LSINLLAVFSKNVYKDCTKVVDLLCVATDVAVRVCIVVQRSVAVIVGAVSMSTVTRHTMSVWVQWRQRQTRHLSHMQNTASKCHCVLSLEIYHSFHV